MRWTTGAPLAKQRVPSSSISFIVNPSSLSSRIRLCSIILSIAASLIGCVCGEMRICAERRMDLFLAISPGFGLGRFVFGFSAIFQFTY